LRLALLQKLLDPLYILCNVFGAVVHGVEHEHDTDRGDTNAAVSRPKRCERPRLPIVEQSEILLLQACHRLAGCIGYKHIENDVVLGLISELPLLMRSWDEGYAGRRCWRLGLISR
jgi:hypothetical protein